ncbi:MAG TPA: hypothetical protein VNW06_09385, partial [Cytophagaceae bacterium]|nr:hypothetical protein [Cytophagaceae bacterium]
MTKQQQKRELGFIGFGGFGRFIIPHLKPYFNVTVFDIVDLSHKAKELGVRWGSLKEVASKDIVALAVPVQFLEELLINIKNLVQPK